MRYSRNANTNLFCESRDRESIERGDMDSLKRKEERKTLEETKGKRLKFNPQKTL
jgi:hypothetical protein